MTPLLSILMSTLYTRRTMAEELWYKLSMQGFEHGEIEMLMLRDDKTRSIGAKRQALLDIAQGEYISFVDDDDDVAAGYIPHILRAIKSSRSDLYVFPIKCTINGGQEGIVEPSIKYVPKDGEPLAEYKPPITCRPPHELSVWKWSIAKSARFPDTSQGEDFAWARQCWPLVVREHRIPHELYHWRHNIKLREHEEKPA